MPTARPIGVFDSGYGGLTVLKDISASLPRYDYLYLGDNARAPYGSRSFETVYRYTLQCVSWLFGQGCPLVIVACNTASAKALRSIQQRDLARIAPNGKILGVIRPTTEVIGNYTHSGKVGILATSGTVSSGSYAVEINKFFPGITVFQEACPMWVPLIESGEYDQPGADYFVEKHMENLFLKSAAIDTVLLACTHYPLMQEKITAQLPPGVQLLSQGKIVAVSLAGYLDRHPEIEQQCSHGGNRNFFTTDSTEDFDRHGAVFFGNPVAARHLDLDL